MVRFLLRRSSVLFLVLSLCPHEVEAGMGNPYPIVYETTYQMFDRLNEVPLARLRAISFFVAVLLLSSWGAQRLWNALGKEFPKLPRLSYGKAVGGVTLWGMLFIIVLTMISGARELMTPGAWKRQGFTYQLDETPSENFPDEMRREGLEELRLSLMQYAASHNGQYPATAEEADVPPESWKVPHRPNETYTYVGGHALANPDAVVAYEPEVTGDVQFVLFASGRIGFMDTFSLQDLLGRQSR